MEKVELEAKLRGKTGRASSRVFRREGKIPAVVYGKEIKSFSVLIDLKMFSKTISGDAGFNVLIDLKMSDHGKAKSQLVLTQEIQRNPLTGEIIHVDFHKIILTEKIKANVPVELIGGTPIGVKEDGGILIHGLREVEVKCLPTEIPEKFELNVSEFKIGDTYHVSDLTVDKEVEVLTLSTEMLANVAPPAKEEELAPAPELAAAEVPSEKGAVPEGAEAIPEEEKAGAEAKGKAEAKAEGKAPKEEGKAPAKEAKPAKEQKK